MVVSIRDLGNKSFSSSAIMHSQQDSDLTLPTVLPINHTGMNNSPEQPPAFNYKMRGQTHSPNRNISRDSSMMSSGRATPYHDRMGDDMDCESTVGDSTLELSYETV